AANGPARERSRAEPAQRPDDASGNRRLPVEHEPAEERARDERDERGEKRRAVEAGKSAGGGESERRSGARRDPDQPELVHARLSVVSIGLGSGNTTAVGQPPLPMLVFFTCATSGPARRMESLLAHVARKQRDRLRVTRVDADEHPELLQRF